MLPALHSSLAARQRGARTARRLARALLACALVLAFASPGYAEAGAAVERRYQIRFIGLDEAGAVAQNLCPAEQRCIVGSMGHKLLSVNAEPAVQERIAAALRAADVPPAAQAFQLVLLEAHRGGRGIPAELPDSVRKALADVAEFLPYGRFDLLAPVAFIRTADATRVTLASDSDEGVSYELDMGFRGDPRQPGSELLIERFRLRLVPAEPMLVALAAHPGFSAGASLPQRPGQASTAAPPAAPAPPARGGAPAANSAMHPAATPAPPEAVTPPPTVAENLLSTSFAIRKGETVVVGTSKLSGNDRALVVLLTALP